MIVGESPLKDAFRRVVWGPWRQLLERAPLGWEYRANRAVGRAAGWTSGTKRAEVRANLERAFPGRAGLDRLAAETFAAHFANQYASFAFARITDGTWSSYLRFEGLDRLYAARDRGRGVVLMHPHMGPAQLPLCALGAMGLPVHQVGGGGVVTEKTATGEWATALRHRLESRLPVTLHDGGGFLRGVLRALASGAIVLSACDGTGGGRELGRRLVRSVLGQPMAVPVGAFYLAWRSGAPLLTLHTVADGPGHVSVIGQEVHVVRDGTLDEALEAGADFTAAWLTLLLARHPGEWHFWDQFHPGGLLR